MTTTEDKMVSLKVPASAECLHSKAIASPREDSQHPPAEHSVQ
jgi:hypothetical protein